MRPLLPFFAVALLFPYLVPANEIANWPSWRGPDGSASANGAAPVKWSADSGLAWKVELPGKGCSTPVVWERRIFVTAPVEGQDAVLAFDWDGHALWQTTVGKENPGKHRNGSGSNPSPATDGASVFAYFKSGSLAALALDGTVRWKTNVIDRFGKETLYWDYGCSPVLTARHVVLAMMHHGESYLVAFDKATGEQRWKVARNYQTPVENDHSYATPIVIQHEGKEAVLVWGAEHLTAHAADDGRILWSCGGFNPRAKPNWVAVSSPVVCGDMAIVPYGRGSRLHGVRLGGTGDVTATHRAWTREDTGTFVPTPAVWNGKAVLVRDRGEVEIIDPLTGRTALKGQLPKSAASYYSSPAIADGKIYAAREDGVVLVARGSEPFEVLSENHMKEQIIASPVPMAGRLLLRSEKHLFCVGQR